jgi:hypothetical protein
MGFTGTRLVDGQTIFVVWLWWEFQFFLSGCTTGWILRACLKQRGVVVDEEVFRASGWSAGFLHLHFSVA